MTQPLLQNLNSKLRQPVTLHKASQAQSGMDYSRVSGWLTPFFYVVKADAWSALRTKGLYTITGSVLVSILFPTALFAESYDSKPSSTDTPPIFDVHLHYNRWDAALFKPETILRKLKHQRIEQAMVTSNPPMLVQTLKQKDPTRIYAWLGVYEGGIHKNNWLRHKNVVKRLAHNLTKGQWAGIGELHLFGQQRFEAVFEKVVRIAESHQLPLLLHCDPVVIDRVFELAPNSRIVWAHAGKYPFPPLLKDYLLRYPHLRIDLSVRESLIAPDGQLSEPWEMLFNEFDDRFFVGVDTYSVNRWASLDQVVAQLRQYLQALPPEVQNALAYENAQRFFKTTSIDD